MNGAWPRYVFIVLLMYDYEKNLNKGDKLILAAFGAGLTWGAAYLTWAYN